jgi:Protein of unknown function (DUF3300)
MLTSEVFDGHQRIAPHGGNEMIRTFAKQLLTLALCFLLVLATGPFAACAQEPAQQSGAGFSGHGVPLTADELQQLVAPIALDPDALVAQILGAATFPDQVDAAAGWLRPNQNLTANTLMTVVNQQSWDPSVKALTQFPSVLENLAKNLSWTSALGEAYHTQAADVMGAIQVLRAKAQAAGNLKSGSQIVVVQQSQQTIVIKPANPQIVYVSTYNPAVVYGYPYVTPGYSYAAVATNAVVAFGIGIAVGAMMSSGYGWGYSSWNCNWQSTTVAYHGGAYYGNAAWHGGGYGSVGYGGVSHYGSSYNPSTGTFARGGTASNGYGSVSAGQAYNPRTKASASTVQGSNAYESYGASTASKNGNTAYSQHQTTSQGTTGQVHTTNGGKAYGASGRYGNSAAVGQTSSGDKYVSANGNTYKNTGSGWSRNSNNTSQYSGSSSSAASRGWGGQDQSGGSSAFSGGGWQSRSDSARGASSFGGGGGWGGRGGGRI